MNSYKDSGVNINEGYKAVELIKNHAKSTNIKGALNGLGSFAGMFSISEYGKYIDPVLVTGTDGVGTKLDVAFRMKKYDTVGIDCVAMCVNDVLCHGASPIFFLDYLACGRLKADVAEKLVSGVAFGCRQSGCVLLGGETAEMPGFYPDGEYDLAGFSVGICERNNIIDGSTIKNSDVLIGIASSGFHSNGYSLLRKLFPDLDEEVCGKKVGDILLTPTKIYVSLILNLLKKYNIKGMAHITGGGFYENIPRMFKEDFTSVINLNSYALPEIFNKVMEKGLSKDELYNTFNMGIGFVICVSENIADSIINDISLMGEKAYKIGYVEKGEKKVCLI